MIGPEVISATKKDRERAMYSVVLSFAADPMMRWMVPNAADYLDSSNPRNIAFYERHGFRVMGKIQHRSSPMIYPMLRKNNG